MIADMHMWAAHLAQYFSANEHAFSWDRGWAYWQQQQPADIIVHVLISQRGRLPWEARLSFLFEHILRCTRAPKMLAFLPPTLKPLLLSNMPWPPSSTSPVGPFVIVLCCCGVAASVHRPSLLMTTSRRPASWMLC